MRETPGGFFYSGTDLGIQDVVVAAGGTATGLIVPWSFLGSWNTVCFTFLITAGPSADFSLRAEGVAPDGLTIDTGPQNLVASFVASGHAVYGSSSSTARASSGTPQTASIPFAFAPPYIRFRLVNNDGANAGTVTLRAHCFKGNGDF